MALNKCLNVLTSTDEWYLGKLAGMDEISRKIWQKVITQGSSWPGSHRSPANAAIVGIKLRFTCRKISTVYAHQKCKLAYFNYVLVCLTQEIRRCSSHTFKLVR
jgi:hypothetical protein